MNLFRPSIGFFLTYAIMFTLWAQSARGSQARTVKLDDKKVARIFITPGRSTILSFPLKPSKVVLGNNGAFKVEYIDNDLAISVRASGLRSNLFVYLQGRRFAFDLVGVSTLSDEIILVRDLAEVSVPLKLKNE